ncbi:MAG: hypothetical protein IT372_06040 [Polyangiaceae bacterium]|nr:hypothetical protein [Polyangiaceae bacterium]
MQRNLVFLGLLAGALSALGCGGEAAQGEECDEAGGEADVCEEGSVCGKHDGASEELVCLKICTDDAQCASDESCNGVEGTSTKGCRLKDK